MDDLKEILAAATPGPWDVDPHGVGDCMGDVWLGEDVRVCENATANDARLIAMAPDLAAEVLRLRAEVERLTKALTEIADMDWHEVEPAHGWVPEGAEGYVGEIEAFCNWALDVSRAALKGTTQ